MIVYIYLAILWVLMASISFAVVYNHYDSFFEKLMMIIQSIIFAPITCGLIIGGKLKDF